MPALALLSSCQKETAFEPTENTVTLTAKLESEATRTYLDGSNYVCWADGDEVWINGETYTASVSGDKVTIAGVAEADNYACVYPAGIVTNFSDGCKVKISLPSSQTITYDGSGRQVLSLPMAAYGDGSSALEFKNLCGLMAVTVNNTDKAGGLTPTRITLSTSDGDGEMTASLYGETWAARDLSSANYDADWAILASNIGSATSSVKWTMSVSISGSPLIANGSSRSYYITVPVIDNGTRSKISVEMSGTLGGNNFIFNKKTTAGTKTIGRNQLGAIPIPSTLCYEIKTSGTDWNGSGTEADPYQISCRDHWNKMAQMVLNQETTSSTCFKQVCDIDFGGASLTAAGMMVWVAPTFSLGSSTYYEREFNGVYDGGGHTISNFALTLPDTEEIIDEDGSHVGIAPFPLVTGTVKNLSVNYSRSYNSNAAYDHYRCFAGIIASARDNAVLSGLTFSGTLTAGSSAAVKWLGGVVAKVEGSVSMSNLNFSGTLHNEGQATYLGGVIAQCDDVYVKDCHAASSAKIEINHFSSCIGGVLGYTNSASQISDCSFAGTISSFGSDPYCTESCVGGIVGKIENFPINKVSTLNNAGGSISIEGSSSAISGQTYVGGFFGYVGGDFCMSGITNETSVTASMKYNVYAGGIAGYIDRSSTWPSEFNGFANQAAVSATSGTDDSCAGGFAGKIAAGGFKFRSFTNSSAICATAADEAYAGGAVGYALLTNTGSDVTMDAISNSGKITAASTGDWSYGGGLFGLLDHGHANITFENCTNGGEVYVESNTNTACAGGFAGYIPGDSYLTRINKFRNSGSITADNSQRTWAAGVVGYDYDGTYDANVQIFNSENRGAITSASGGDAAGGGFFGYHDSNGGSTYNPCVINCCNRGDITVNGSSSGDVYIGGIVGYCYNDDTEIGCSYSRANLVSFYYEDLYCGGMIGEGDFCDTGSQWELLQTVSGALAPEYSRHDGGKKAATFSGSEIATALNVAQAEVPQLSSYIQNIPDLLKWKLDSDDCPALTF